MIEPRNNIIAHFYRTRLCDGLSGHPLRAKLYGVNQQPSYTRVFIECMKTDHKTTTPLKLLLSRKNTATTFKTSNNQPIASSW